MRAARAIVLSALALAFALPAACGGKARPPFATLGGDGGSGGTVGAAGSGFDAGNTGPPGGDAGGLCGNDIIPVVTDRPNLYFVLDRSGSMGDPQTGSTYNKYINAKIAIRDLLFAIGHRVSYGAAVFPDPKTNDCDPGVEVFPTRPGDPVSYAAAGNYGPNLGALMDTLAYYTPGGGTPTAGTFEALLPTLTTLAASAKTFVVLATDGAPNCNLAATCTADKCMLNIDHFVFDTGQACDATFNCCDPANVSLGQSQCVDGTNSAAAVQALADAGIKTYVIGMPGSEIYGDVLDGMAEAGGTARAVEPKYYKTSNATELEDTLRQIGVTVAISCDIQLDQPPPDKGLVNVYFDTTTVPYSSTTDGDADPGDGWVWTSDSSLSLVGPACDKLKSGDVLQVQVVSGCPTTVH